MPPPIVGIGCSGNAAALVCLLAELRRIEVSQSKCSGMARYFPFFTWRRRFSACAVIDGLPVRRLNSFIASESRLLISGSGVPFFG